MSIRLRELIRAVRQCKTAAEERNVIAKESAALRTAFREQDTLYRHRNVAKLMYMHMLGYPTHFGQMEALKLIASNGFAEKRIGYLGLMILLDERQEVLMLVTNSLKNDLNAHNQYTVGLALCALGNICSAEMARDLSPELERLLQSPNSYLRKKVALCCIRLLRKVPDAVDTFLDRAAAMLSDRHHGVLLTGVSLMLEICALDPSAIEHYRPQVPALCKIQRGLLLSGFAPEHDVGGITDPFLQVKVLQLLRVLGAGSAEASDAMADVLAQTATATEALRSAGNAILYEAVQTIMGVESIGGLRVLAINILGRFLGNRDNNIRYVALNILARVVAVDTQAVQRHRTTVVECVKDADVSIRRRALDLVYALVNEGNIKALTRELLEYLQIADAEFKPDLTAKIAALVQRFAPDKRWHFDSLLQVMVQAGDYVAESVCRALVVLLANDASLHAYAARAFYAALKEHEGVAAPSLALTATWFLGEYGELVVGGAKYLEGEPRVVAAPGDVVGLVEGVLARHPAARDVALTSLMKLSARFPDQAPRVQAAIAAHRASPELEAQARAVEYGALFHHARLAAGLLERLPPMDAAAAARATASVDPAAAAALAPQAAGDDLLTLDDAEPAPVVPGGQSAADALADLLGDGLAVGPGAAAMSAAAPASGGATMDLLDLLGGGANGTAAPAPQLEPTAEVAGGPLAGLDNGAARGSAAPTAPPPITAYESGGLRVVFAFSKPLGRPEQTDIAATYTNSGPTPIASFVLQAAVPKFMQLRLDPASGSHLPAGGAGAITQGLHIMNSAHGQKPLALRLRISFIQGSEPPRVEQVEVKNLPPGL